jgi:Sec-independent protein translocase protein TatA
MFGMSDGILILIAVIAMLFLAPPKIVEWARALGQAKVEFEKASKGEGNNVGKEIQNEKMATN